MIHRIKYFLLTFFGLLLYPTSAHAHCPLCTLGAGLIAGTAAYMGVDVLVVGVVIGGFSWLLGRWFAKTLSGRIGKFVAAQDLLLSAIIYLTIVIPIRMGIEKYISFYLSLAGDYGTLLNRTYVINSFLLGSVIGLLAVVFALPVSNLISKIRGESLRFQGMAMTLLILILTASITWFVTL